MVQAIAGSDKRASTVQVNPTPLLANFANTPTPTFTALNPPPPRAPIQ